MQTTKKLGLAMRGYVAGVAGLLLCGMALGPTAHGDTIYDDDFSGLSSANLEGTAPDTRPGSETWIARDWKADGTHTWAAQYTYRNAFLPFIPETGKLYRLETQMSVTETYHVCFGFVGDYTNATQSATQGKSRNFEDFVEASGYWRATGPELAGAREYLYSNVGESSSYEGLNTDGPILAVELDTRASQWEFEFFLDGTSVRTYQYAVDENPTIKNIAFGSINTTTSTVEGTATMEYFTLTVIPEPGTLAIFGLGSLALLALRRRRS
ncbi:MAG: PEP-CTERM sorting domain-containing protein [Candidatus Marinimicrobia bacterium]|nr:PEP-CTERM sorting domain-containing protein [Candidatus Neomarinimicrobiota bacterium]